MTRYSLAPLQSVIILDFFQSFHSATNSPAVGQEVQQEEQKPFLDRRATEDKKGRRPSTSILEETEKNPLELNLVRNLGRKQQLTGILCEFQSPPIFLWVSDPTKF